MSANHARFGPAAEKSRPTRSSARTARAGAFLAGGPFGARARDAAPAVVAHDAGHPFARGAHPQRAQTHERLRRAVYVPDIAPDLGYQGRQLGIPRVVGGCRPQRPGVVALAGAAQGKARHISETPYSDRWAAMNANLAPFACAPTAACWRRRRSLLKVSRARAWPPRA